MWKFCHPRKADATAAWLWMTLVDPVPGQWITAP
jgi:hypothetical protein